MAASVVHNILKEPAVLKGWSHYQGKNIPKPEGTGPNPLDAASTLDTSSLCHGKKKQIFEIILLPFHFNSPYPIHVKRCYCIFHAITCGLSVDISVFEAAVGNMAAQVM